MGSQLKFSTAFHPQTDGQSERTIQTLEDMLRACVLDFQGRWVDHLSLVEFAYNNSYHASIGMAPFEALYGRKCRTPLCWDEAGERRLEDPKMVDIMVEKVRIIRARLKIAQDRQKSYADGKRRDLTFEVGELVFLKVAPWKGVIRFRKRSKLNPRYIGPFAITERVGPVAYRLELPSELSQVHDVFHISMLRKYVADPSHVFKPPPVDVQPDMSVAVRPIAILDRGEKTLRNKSVPMVKVLWRSDRIEEESWEPEAEMRRLHSDLFKNCN